MSKTDEKTNLAHSSLENQSKEMLVDRIKQLEAHVQQLQNVIAKGKGGGTSEPVKKTGLRKSFDFKRFKRRHVALKFLYLGWDYHGLAAQEDNANTIETHLFDALTKTCLIESRQTSNYHRCGRTDKGVSAFSQVISLDLRSNLHEGEQLITPEGYIPPNEIDPKRVEFRYTHILNRVLPPNIRMIAWASVKPDFSARFDCKERTYKYIFPIGNMDISRMEEATNFLIGEHDFRNLCKADRSQEIQNFKREIKCVSIKPVQTNLNGVDSYHLYELTIVGNAFLWHQIRCIVAVLFLVGQCKEDPIVIRDLLDLEKHPEKPQYAMASELPLVLFDCQFEDLEWCYDTETLTDVVKKLQELWTQEAVKTTLIRRMLNSLESHIMLKDNPVSCQIEALEMGVKSKVYKTLLDRPTGGRVGRVLEEAAQEYKKIKLDPDCVKVS